MATPRPLHALISSTGHPASASSSNLVSPHLVALADPPQHTVDARLVELLADEMIRAVRESHAAARTRRARDHRAVEEELEALGLAGAPPAGGAADPAADREGHGVDGQAREDEADEAVRSRLDDLGFRVGWATAERCVLLTPLLPVCERTTDPLPRSQPRTRPTALPLARTDHARRLAPLVRLRHALAHPATVPLRRRPFLARDPRGRQVRVQGRVDRAVRQAGRQPPDQPPRRLRPPRPELAQLEGAQCARGQGRGARACTMGPGGASLRPLFFPP